ncbi:MAG: phosphatase PAP2 family protein, partial [Acidimicrobiales bacterium]|nr:phosphatase PAP2 family protein [Acidimicrobiales bacterium]
VAGFTQEVALISFLYMVWRLARQLPLVHEEGAYDRGRWIWDVQRWLHLPSELSMERWLERHETLAHWTVTYYATVHVPSLLLFLLWLWVRHRDQYPRWRNALAITTGFCLFLRFIRVAPPRLLPELGFVDLPAELGRDIYGPLGTGASDQFAAMPSIHVAWAAIVCFGIFTSTRSRWRWIGPIHLALTFWAVMATANHWWLDGIVAVALVGLSLWIDDVVRAWAARRGPERDDARLSEGGRKRRAPA